MRFTFEKDDGEKKSEKKSEYKNACSFEISGIKKVVENKVRVVNGGKVREGETHVWQPIHRAKGTRWLLSEWGTLTQVKDKVQLEGAILDGMSAEEMHDYILGAMKDPVARVWFSDGTCNIEDNLTHREKMHSDRFRRGLANALKKVGLVKHFEIEKVNRR